MYILLGVHMQTFSKLKKDSAIIHFYRTMMTMTQINAESPYNFQWEKQKVEIKTEDLIAKDNEYTSMPYGE